ncbi:hypothetical protein J1N35_029325 [Gossypium stocksii]|uniref:Uncharacterized protein n=1 Tax=Gossypium stocksii TaxID=47602 RepID=A0A9D3UXL2_9ROSI|nr:hypothetical protein J1N35_029325 [Gossypium stocksii]
MFLIGCSDADWAGNIDDRESTSGGCFYLESSPVSWYIKKQGSVSLSTIEAKYIVVSKYSAQLLWMRSPILKNMKSSNNLNNDQLVWRHETLNLKLWMVENGKGPLP